MRDPCEGITPTGAITTGVHRDRVPDAFEPVLSAVIESVREVSPAVSIYVYGSVATGHALVGGSDVDLLTIDLPADRAGRLGAELSTRFSGVCRDVEIAAAAADDFTRNDDEAYGGRAFLHHYCVHLAGPDRDHATTAFPADERTARGFNGDIARHASRWRESLARRQPIDLGRKMARKSLLAVAGLVSIHDHTWTTDRHHAARRWSEIEPGLSTGLDQLLSWTDAPRVPNRHDVADALDRTVQPIVARFAEHIGLWP